MGLINIFKSLCGANAQWNAEILRDGVRKVYSAAASNPNKKYPFPIGRKFAESIGYPPDQLETIPPAAIEAFVGVSNVAIFADVPAEATVLDVGCGGGLDSILVCLRDGFKGRVIGIDFSDTMLARARTAINEMALNTHATFVQSAAEALPIKTRSVDLILVNGIFNLNPERQQVFTELARVIKAGGKLYAAEMVFTEPVPPPPKTNSVDDWFA